MMTNEIGKITIRKNDQVQVMAGREKGKTGKVLKVDRQNQRIFIEKVNLVKRHVRPSQKNPQGGVLDKEAPLHYSNVLLLCPKCNRGVRHGVKMVEKTKGKKATGQKVKTRVCKRCGETLGTA